LGITLGEFRFFKRYECLTGDAYPNEKFIFAGRINIPIEDMTLFEGERPQYFKRSEIPHVNFANILREVVMDYINETDGPGKV